jgi:transcriptional regulator with XRE-family HTH domain
MQDLQHAQLYRPSSGAATRPVVAARPSDGLTVNMTPSEINDALKACRLEAGLSQEELARRLACSQAWVSKIERGRAEPSITDAARWVEVCGAGSLELIIGSTRDVVDAADLVRLMRRSPEVASIVKAALSLADKAASMPIVD